MGAGEGLHKEVYTPRLIAGVFLWALHEGKMENQDKEWGWLLIFIALAIGVTWAVWWIFTHHPGGIQ